MRDLLLCPGLVIPPSDQGDTNIIAVQFTDLIHPGCVQVSDTFTWSG